MDGRGGCQCFVLSPCAGCMARRAQSSFTALFDEAFKYMLQSQKQPFPPLCAGKYQLEEESWPLGMCEGCSAVES